MKPLRHLLWWPAHALVSLTMIAWAAVFRRGAVLVFTHWPDVDHDGRDRQMGPLVDALRTRGQRFVEVTLVPASELLANLRLKRRGFVSLAIVHGPARVLSALLPGDRQRYRILLARALYWALRPCTVVLIDESGSGQALLRAARRGGVPVLAVQHGDFQRDNPQYAHRRTGDDGASLSRSPEDLSGAQAPADALCVWSPWFRDRLLRVSGIYHENNVLVTGRLRYDDAAAPGAGAPEEGSGRRRRVLLVSENRSGFAEEVRPFLDSLRSAPDLELRIRAHPGEPPGTWDPAELCGGALSENLRSADVVVGVRSSALLEGLFWGRPTVALQPAEGGSIGFEVSLPTCGAPEALPALCRDSAALERASQRSRERVWGGAPAHPVQCILTVIAAERKKLRTEEPFCRC